MFQQGDYRDLIVWQKAMELVVDVYRLTKEFPPTEIYGLTSQMRRAAVSIPSNIAEGRRRGTEKDNKYFLRVAFGSGAELETQIEIANRLCYIDNSNFQKIHCLVDEVMKMLNKMSSSI